MASGQSPQISLMEVVGEQMDAIFVGLVEHWPYLKENLKHTWTFQFGCQMVAKGVSINHPLGFNWHPERKVLAPIWMFPKIVGFSPPKHPFVHRVFP